MQTGTIPVGSICKLEGWMPKVIVEAWIPREYCGPGGPTMMRGGHIAQVRSLKDGKRFRISDAWLIDWIE